MVATVGLPARFDLTEAHRITIRVMSRSVWMREHGYGEPPVYPDDALWGFRDRFWRRVLGVKSWSRKEWQKIQNTVHAVGGDHWDCFTRDGVEAALVTQPYIDRGDIRSLDSYEAKWRELAERHGLHLHISAEESWHYPGKTVLYVLSIPRAEGK